LRNSGKRSKYLKQSQNKNLPINPPQTTNSFTVASYRLAPQKISNSTLNISFDAQKIHQQLSSKKSEKMRSVKKRVGLVPNPWTSQKHPKAKKGPATKTKYCASFPARLFICDVTHTFAHAEKVSTF
jgi:hypothetical protein